MGLRQEYKEVPGPPPTPTPFFFPLSSVLHSGALYMHMFTLTPISHPPAALWGVPCSTGSTQNSDLGEGPSWAQEAGSGPFGQGILRLWVLKARSRKGFQALDGHFPWASWLLVPWGGHGHRKFRLGHFKAWRDTGQGPSCLS